MLRFFRTVSAACILHAVRSVSARDPVFSAQLLWLACTVLLTLLLAAVRVLR